MDTDALRTELARLHKSAFGWAMVCCGRNRDVAAEVLQQAYLRILSGDASFGEKSEFSTWVFGVIRHVAYEELRSQQRQLMQHQISFADQFQTGNESARITIEQQELAEQLNSAFEKLSVRQREVLHLTFYESMTIEQAASIMKTSVGTARQHYQRGKASLARILSTRQELEP